jgi:hypothetical protein
MGEKVKQYEIVGLACQQSNLIKAILDTET